MNLSLTKPWALRLLQLIRWADHHLFFIRGM